MAKEIYTCEFVEGLLRNEGYKFKVLEKVQNEKAIIFKMRCPQGTMKKYYLATINKNIEKGLNPCKCCRLKEVRENAKSKFRSFELEPLNIEDEYFNSSSFIHCLTKEGYIVLLTEKNIKESIANNFPSPFSNNNKYKYQNLKVLCKKVGFSKLLSKSYINYDAPYFVEDKDGYKYKIYIGNLLSRDISSFFKYDKDSPYLLDNINITLKKHGYTIIPNTLNPTKKTVDAINPEGYSVTVCVYQLDSEIISHPSPFDSRCKYYYENLQLLLNKQGMNIRVDKIKK